MAAVLETNSFATLLAPVFVFILVFVVTYALLKKSKFLGESEGAHALVAFIVSIFMVMFPESSVVISSFIPWAILMFVLILFIFMFFMFLGVKEETLRDSVVKDSTFITFAVAAVAVLFLVALTKAFGPFLMVTGKAGFWEATKRAIFNPRFLGMLFLLAVASYTIRFMGDPGKK